MQHVQLEEQTDTVILRSLVELYALEVTAIGSKGRGYMVFGQDGVFWLQPEEDKAEVVAMLQRWDHLYAIGFKGLTPLQATTDGDLGFYLDDHIAYLRGFSPGRVGELTLREDVMRTAKLLAQLHVCSRELPRALWPEPVEIEDIRNLHVSRQADMSLFKKMATHRLYPTAFDGLFLEAYDVIAHNAAESLEVLASLNRGNIPLARAIPVGLLKQSCRGADLWVADDGNVCLRHLKGAAWGPFALDVVTFLDNVGYYSEWSQATGQRALACYEKDRPLERGEFQLIYGIGVFPKGTWDVAYEYYKGNRRQDELQFILELRLGLDRDIAAGDFWRWLAGVELGL
mgnify:FL=1